MLNEKDYRIIEEARKAIKANYGEEHCNHTVGAAVCSKNGKIYAGVNIFSLHGACAEQVAIGTAVTNGEREFETIVAVREKEGDEIIPPCGNCRQILHNYMPECCVIVHDGRELRKIKAKDLLPFAYSFE